MLVVHVYTASTVVQHIRRQCLHFFLSAHLNRPPSPPYLVGFSCERVPSQSVNPKRRISRRHEQTQRPSVVKCGNANYCSTPNHLFRCFFETGRTGDLREQERAGEQTPAVNARCAPVRESSGHVCERRRQRRAGWRSSPVDGPGWC